jgi:hypothetical protein
MYERLRGNNFDIRYNNNDMISKAYIILTLNISKIV